MPSSFDDRYHTSPYQHIQFPAGCWIQVSESIRDLHPDSPFAGKRVQACIGQYAWSNDAVMGRALQIENLRRHFSTYVPVKDEQGQVWFIEEEYVTLSEEGSD